VQNCDSRRLRAVWTRFHPIAYAVQDFIHSGKLGKVKRFSSEFSKDLDPDSEWFMTGLRY
jgi:predicted dehydrogenase